LARQRARELGIELGSMETGKLNAITDVKGVGVGHSTLVEGESIRTGVTAIAPHRGSLIDEKVVAAVDLFNAYGKSTGLPQIIYEGVLETPIVLTETLNTWRVADAVVDYHVERMGISPTSLNVVVGETNGSYLTDNIRRHVGREHVFEALDIARSASGRGRVLEGNVGGGTPTVLAVELWEVILKSLRDCFDCSQLTEFTVEANPDDLRQVLVFHKLHDLLQPGLQQVRVVAHQGHADPGFLPQLVVSHFGHRRVKLVPHALHEAFDHPALALQGVVLRDNQGNHGCGDNHGGALGGSPGARKVRLASLGGFGGVFRPGGRGCQYGLHLFSSFLKYFPCQSQVQPGSYQFQN